MACAPAPLAPASPAPTQTAGASAATPAEAPGRSSSNTPPEPAEAWPPADAAGGSIDPAVADLLRRHWSTSLELDPLGATELGIHRFDDRVDDNSPEGHARQRALGRGFLAEARGLLGRAELGAADRTSLTLLAEALESDLAAEVCAFEDWSLSAASNPLTRWNRLPEAHTVASVESGQALVARYAQIAAHIDREIEHLRSGLARGLVSNTESTRRVIEMIEQQLAQPLEQWPLLEPARAAHPSWPAAERQEYDGRLRELVAQQIKPAFERYLRLLRTEILPKAHGDDASGLVHLPNGAACYRARILAHTSLTRDPRELHQIGLQQIERLDRELSALAKKAIGSADLAGALQQLRQDPSLHFQSAEQIVAAAEQALERARLALPRAFTRLPRAPCVVARIPDYEAPFAWAAYYRHPLPDGSKPGEYFVNVYQPETRPRFEAAVLAFHESIPGHHVQIALAQELGELPAFRKHWAPTAFVEGWALYTERLADELGLYETDLDRIGLLSFDAWRASRLVVDTGIHAFGWSRQRAIAFMLAHTALSADNIGNEVDRYIVWPGQALAYKLGQLEILALRELAQRKLGPRFELPAFHAALLEGGGVSLPLLRAAITSYIERAARGS
jgi:uncharacterized protein (DUF885 family)